MFRWLDVRAVLDRLVAVVLLVVLGPLLAAIAIVVRWRDGSPALVRLPRIGRGGTRFLMLKFRTMRADDPSGVAAGPRLTAGADPRVTQTGRLLRRHRLDELPQLLNVIRGEMALIGPRPETPEYVSLEEPRWKEALTARPGIAGLTQVLVADIETALLGKPGDEARYQNELLPLKLELDCLYAASASPLLDARIVWALARRIADGGVPIVLREFVAQRRPEVACHLVDLEGEASHR